MSENKLPQNWAVTNISKLIDANGLFKDGDWIESKDQNPEGKVRLIQLADIGLNYFRNKSSRFLTEGKAKDLKCSYIEKGDVLVARMPDPIGRSCIFPLEGKYVTVVDVAIIRGNNKVVSNKWLSYIINSPKFHLSIHNLASGSTRKRISRKNLDKIKFPLPPRPEQDRIVAKVDTLMDQVSVMQESLQRIPQLLKDFRQQVLTQAVTGKLTEEWREGKELESKLHNPEKIFKKRWEEYKNDLTKSRKPNYLSYKPTVILDHKIPSWKVSPIGFLNDCIVPGRDKPKSFTGDIPWITTPDLISDSIESSTKNIGLTETEIKEVKAKVIPLNSVIISIVGRFGISAINTKKVVINQQLHAFLPSEFLIPKYLMYFIRTQRNFMNSLSSSTTVAYINKTKANSIPISVPAILEQQEIVSRVESLFSKADAIQQQYEALKQKIDTLPQAILHKAFKGELVEQLESDGSAEELLREIEGLKEVSGKKK